jgi:hypothetical protein
VTVMVFLLLYYKIERRIVDLAWSLLNIWVLVLSVSMYHVFGQLVNIIENTSLPLLCVS